jgi:hypothetical protein
MFSILLKGNPNAYVKYSFPIQNYFLTQSNEIEGEWILRFSAKSLKIIKNKINPKYVLRIMNQVYPLSFGRFGFNQLYQIEDWDNHIWYWIGDTEYLASDEENPTPNSEIQIIQPFYTATWMSPLIANCRCLPATFPLMVADDCFYYWLCHQIGEEKAGLVRINNKNQRNPYIRLLF